VALPVSKDFTAANGTALTTYDSNFQNNSGALVINTNGVCPNAATTECGVRWNGDTFDDDQYSQATLAAKPASDSFFIGVGVRHAAAGTASYYLYYTANTQTFFGKLITGTFTAFGAVMGGRTAGEVLRIEAEGTTIRAKVDGATQRTQTDSALTSGAAGLTGYDTSTTLRLDDWEAGNVTPDPTPTYVASGAMVVTATNNATMAPQAPASRAAGDILVLVAHTSGNGDFNDTITNWTKLASGTEANTAAQKVECWWRVADGTASDNATVGGIADTNVRGARIFAVRNAANQAPTVARSNNAASATVTFPAATAASTTTLSVLAYAYEDDPTAIGTVSGFSAFDPDTSTTGTDMAIGMDAYRANTTSGSQTGGTATVSGGSFANSVNVGLHFIFEPEGAADATLTAALATATAASPVAVVGASEALVAATATATAAALVADLAAGATLAGALATATAASPVATPQAGAVLAGSLATATAASPASTIAISEAATLTAALATASAASPTGDLLAGVGLTGAPATATAASPVAAVAAAATLAASATTATASSPVAVVGAVAALGAGLATASAAALVATLAADARLDAALTTATAASGQAAITAGGAATLEAALATATAQSLGAALVAQAHLAAALATATASSAAATIDAGSAATLAASLATATATSPAGATLSGATLAGALALATADSPVAVVQAGATLAAATGTATAAALVAAFRNGSERAILAPAGAWGADGAAAWSGGRTAAWSGGRKGSWG
jgi:hypothetical protein